MLKSLFFFRMNLLLVLCRLGVCHKKTIDMTLSSTDHIKKNPSESDCDIVRSNCLTYTKEGTKLLCNGHGKCNCGKCDCADGFYGQFCEKCEGCPDRCEELRPCVQCIVHHTGELDDEDECGKSCREFPSPRLVDDASPKGKKSTFCASTDPTDGCRFYFNYYYDEKGGLLIEAQRIKDCPPEPPTFSIMFVITLGAGLILLCCICICLVMYCFHRRNQRLHGTIGY